MMHGFTVEFCVPKERLSPEAVTGVLDRLAAAGFYLEFEPGKGVRYGDGWDIFDGGTVSDAVEYYRRAASANPPNEFLKDLLSWGIGLFKQTQNGDVEVWLSIGGERPERPEASLLTVSLSGPTGWRRDDEWDSTRRPDPLILEFLEWSRLLAELTHPVYGWGGTREGLWNGATLSASSIAATDLQVIEWLNLFGPPYINRIGRDTILKTPAWRVEQLSDGSLMVVLGPDPREINSDHAREVARYLGLPTT